MSDYRRYFVAGGTYFFTLVTRNRVRLFANERARNILGEAMRDCLADYPVDVVAIVLLQDHLHALWSLPPGDARYSLRWSRIKQKFTRDWLAANGTEQPRSLSDLRKRQRAIWQRRFWEHTIRDERDLESHFDYIHYNPVKHGYVKRPRDWPWSSFHRWVESGHYDIHWAAGAHLTKLPGNAGE